jgi:hypothetical protein
MTVVMQVVLSSGCLFGWDLKDDVSIILAWQGVTKHNLE